MHKEKINQMRMSSLYAETIHFKRSGLVGGGMLSSDMVRWDHKVGWKMRAPVLLQHL